MGFPSVHFTRDPAVTSPAKSRWRWHPQWKFIHDMERNCLYESTVYLETKTEYWGLLESNRPGVAGPAPQTAS